ncbi:MAG: secretin N-terminal domain-containing protein, partial [Fusobacteriaceae bacterium]
MKNTSKIFIIIFVIFISLISFSKIKEIKYKEPLNFDGIELRDVVSILSEESGMTLLVDESNRSRVINLNFAVGENLENILNIIASTTNLKLTELSPNSYIFESRKNNRKGGQNLIGIVRLENYNIGLDGVKITLLDSGVSPVYSELSGKYILKNVLPGTYIARYEKKGFVTAGEFLTMGTKETKGVPVEMERDRNNPENKFDVVDTIKEEKKDKQYGNSGVRIIERIQLTNLNSDDAKKVLDDLMGEGKNISAENTKINKKDKSKEEESQTETLAAENENGDITQNKFNNDDKFFSNGDENFKVVSLAKLNTILLNGTVDKVETAKSLLRDLDNNSKQVRISAQILDITDGLFEKLGFSWTYAGGAIENMDAPYYPQNIGKPITIPNPIRSDFSSGTNKMLKGSINLNFIRFFNSASEFLDFSIEMLQSTEDATTSAV